MTILYLFLLFICLFFYLLGLYVRHNERLNQMKWYKLHLHIAFGSPIEHDSSFIYDQNPPQLYISNLLLITRMQYFLSWHELEGIAPLILGVIT